MFLKNSKNIVIKIGSSLLVDKKQKIRLIINLIFTILKCLIKRRKINFNTELS